MLIYVTLHRIITPYVLAGALFFVLGLALGSFGNVIIYRLPANRKITGRSQCQKCSKNIAPKDLIPVISFLLLRGKCRCCSQKISIQYPIVEFVSGCIFLASFLSANSLFAALLLGISLWLLWIIVIIDLSTQSIPDSLNLSFAFFGIVYGIFLSHLSILSFVIGIGFFALQWIFSRGRWIGSGDVLLAIGLTALLGAWPRVVAMICISYIIGAIVAAYLLIKNKKHSNETLAFAPFLAAGTVIILFVGDLLLNSFFLI